MRIMEVMRMEKTLKVEGMHCKSCEILISDALSEIAGVKNVRADNGTVSLSAIDGAAMEEAKKAIAREGYKVVG